MLARRSDMLVRLFDDLATAHEVGRGDLRLDLRAVAVGELCRSVLDQRLSADTSITVDVPDEVVAVADPVRLNQILDNLVTNAVKYGGPHVRVSASQDRTSVQLRVTDDGPGIPIHLRSTLFQAYTRGDGTDHGFGGLGLGLSIVKQLCEAMHGSVAYDDHGGSTFVVTLPALPKAHAELGYDAAADRHAVFFWQDCEQLAEQVARYAALGLSAGEAVLVAATPDHERLVEKHLAALGVDVPAVVSGGQYRTLAADTAHRRLASTPQLEQEVFQRVLGAAIDDVRREWRAFRVFGEVVDLFWRHGDADRALDLEACWNQLLEQRPFPLLCAYEVTGIRGSEALRDCHRTVVTA
jgi:two-component sensor histidine kinase